MGSQLDKDWSDIEVFIKQRSDNLPRLIQTCRSYMPREQTSLKLLTDARSAQQKARSMQEKTEASAKTTQALETLFYDAGRADGLKSNNTYIQLQNQLLEIGERIAERRDTFNEDATRFNARLARFPGSLFARKGKLKPRAPWMDSR
ncbi:MAG: LemA family protein [Terriglobia bacterium]